jgi:predicted phage tail protein
MTACAIRTVRLYGVLGSRFGRVHHFALDSNSPAEAVRALCSQFRGFEAFLMQAKDRGLGFAVFAGKRNLDKDQLTHPVGGDDIRIAPMILGSKNGGIFQIIMGAVLFVIGAVGVFFLGWTGIGAVIGYDLMGMGLAMAVGGVVQLLSPPVKGLSSKDKPANAPSYSFNGPVNTEAQGHPVPLLYGGPMPVGSAVISAGIDVKDNSAAYNSRAPVGGSAGGMGGGGNLNRGRTEVR